MSAAVGLALTPILQFFDNSGRPNVGGSILTQVGGVNFPTYQDEQGSTPLPNPIPLNSRGEISDSSGQSRQLFLVAGLTYVFTFYDALGNQINQATYAVGNNLQSSVSVLQFGADPTGVADSTAAIQAAVNAAIAAKTCLRVPEGSFLVSSLITVSSPLSIRGAGKYVTVIQTNQANASIFSFSAQFFDLADMTLQGPSAPTSGSLITCSCSSENIRNVRLSNYYTGITGSGNVGIYEGVDLNVAATTSSVGVNLTGYAGGLVIDKMIGYVPTVTPIAGILVVACGALQITNSNIIKQGTNLLLIPGSGQTVASVMAVNTYFDSAQNFNVHIAPQAGGTVVRTYLTQCETSSSSGRGIAIDGSAGTVDGVCIISPQANLCASDGIYITGTNAKNIDIVGGQCGQNGGSGISIGASAQNVNVVGTRTGSGYGLTGNVDGIYIDSTCSGVKLTGVIAEGNSGAQIADGANSDIIGCVGATDTTYSNFGNGLVMQSGTFTSSATAGAAVAVTFSKPFQNGVIAVLPAADSASSTTAAAWFDTPTKTGFNGHCSAATTGVSYIAIGY
ncbi:MAG: right-handed parallel beta-helix repeat-containing protein [Betaproteobacteria bacterium]|nr:right-handed parallel beta-helix repeat-containing protein [Betaproteobacteria bacterium]